MLGRHHDRIDPPGFVIVVFDSHLALTVRPQEIEDAAFPHLGQLPADAMGIVNRHGA